MNTKPKAYEVGYQIIEHRSIVVLATSEADAIAKAQALDYLDPELFELCTGLPEFWNAQIVES